jgi:hypothetical protein
MPVRLAPLCRTAAVLGVLVLAALLGASAGQAATVPWGELGHFGTNAGELTSPQPAFGVDPEDGSAWAVDVSGEGFRIQKFENGKVVASRDFGSDEGAEPEANVEVEGVAFDASKKRAYVLVTEERQAKPEEGPQAASELWAFSTSTSGGKIEFASETTNGVLVPRTTENLKSAVGQTKFAPDDTEKVSPGPSLLDPSGIAVNPVNHQILVTGWVGRSEKETPTVWAISEKGKIEGDWEDESKFFEDCGCISSPVVTSTGKILVLGEQEEAAGEDVYQIPSSLNSKEPPKRAFWLPTLKRPCEILEEEAKEGKKVELCPFVEHVTQIFAGYGSLVGGEMTIGSDGDLYISIQVTDINANKQKFGGVMVLNPNLEEVGWTGGGSSASSSGACAVNETGAGGGGAALIGAYKESVMMYERGEPKSEQQKILELGTGGKTESCPQASATPPAATVDGKTLPTYPLADKITFSSEVSQANALSTEWEYEPGVTEVVKARQQQLTHVEHKFAHSGTWTVKETIYTDDLAAPKIETSTKVTISGPSIRDTESAVEGTTATLKAEVDPNAQNTKCHFEYAKVGEALGGAGAKSVECPKAPGEGETYVAESVKIEDLAAGEYHFRLVANETDGPEATFKIAEAGAPEAVTDAATNIAITSVTLNGAVNPEGHTTTCKFEYGMTSVSEASKPCATEPGSGTANVSEMLALSGLKAGTSYKFRISAENSEGKKASGSEMTFTTLALLPPTVETLGAASVTETAATLTGKVDPRGQASSCKFLYGTTTAYGQEVPCTTAPGSGSSPVGVTASISGLAAGTIYHYRLLAENPSGSVSGGDEEFRTVSAPVVEKPGTPPGGGEVKGFTEALPKVSIFGTSLTVASSGGFSLKLSCPAGLTQCAGTVTLKTLTAVAAKAKKSILTLATASFTIASGKVKVLSLHLTSKGRALLAKDHTLRARLTVIAKNPQGATSTTTASVTFRAAKKKKH